MPIVDYDFQDRVFFAREKGDISINEAREWSEKLGECAAKSPRPIVALVDALAVTGVNMGAQLIFSRASFTANLMAVVVATNITASLTSSNIGLMGKQRHTHVFPTLEEARQYVDQLLKVTDAESS